MRISTVYARLREERVGTIFEYRRPEIRWELGGDGGAHKGRRREGGSCPGVWAGPRGGRLGDGEDDGQALGLAGEVSRDPSPREIDQLLATGEEQSVALLAMALHDREVPAVY